MSKIKTVAILGASANHERYAYKAIKLLAEYGHHVVLINPNINEIENQKCYATLEEVQENVVQNNTGYKNFFAIDTITIYLRPELSTTLFSAIKSIHPKRVIFNPGAENEELERALLQEGIEVINGCTLVLLKTDQF
ncbi:MAG: CoA-binding protein [Oligoflexia bacterium]|nr:CoA-binding protein [Oligoflexia bacterium]